MLLTKSWMVSTVCLHIVCSVSCKACTRSAVFRARLARNNHLPQNFTPTRHSCCYTCEQSRERQSTDCRTGDLYLHTISCNMHVTCMYVTHTIYPYAALLLCVSFPSQWRPLSSRPVTWLWMSSTSPLHLTAPSFSPVPQRTASSGLRPTASRVTSVLLNPRAHSA